MLKDSTFFLLSQGLTEQKLWNYKYSWTDNQYQDDAGARRSNSAEFSTELTGSQAQK